MPHARFWWQIPPKIPTNWLLTCWSKWNITNWLRSHIISFDSYLVSSHSSNRWVYAFMNFSSMYNNAINFIATKSQDCLDCLGHCFHGHLCSPWCHKRAWRKGCDIRPCRLLRWPYHCIIVNCTKNVLKFLMLNFWSLINKV